MVTSEISKSDKLEFLKIIFLFSGSGALLWYFIVKSWIDFPRIIFWIFMDGLLIIFIVIVYKLRTWLTTFHSEM